MQNGLISINERGEVMKRFLLFALITLGISLSGCSLPTRMITTIPPDPSNPVYTVAVLPMYNATNDVSAPQMVRELADKHVQGRGHYSVKPLSEVNQTLRDQMGITLGSQMDMTNPQQLGATLGVDGVLYGYLLNFDDMTTGVYNEKKVRAGFKLIDTKTGRVVWAAGHGVKSTTASGLLGAVASSSRDSKANAVESFNSIPGVAEIPRIGEWHLYSNRQESSITESTVLSLGGKLLGKATGTHLKAETETMLDLIFANFPAGRGSGVE